MLTLVIPAYNEEGGIEQTIKTSQKVFNSMGISYEIIVVDDGSTDTTSEKANTLGVHVIRHPENVGYGAAIKTGILNSKFEWVAIVDADGSYPIQEFPKLWNYTPSYDMVVGARKGQHFWGSFFKEPARKMFLWLSEFVTGRNIPDVNSGMRIFRKDIVIKYFDNISSGFSFTTTITLVMLLESHFVKFVPISYFKRRGKSHIRYLRDTFRTSQIIVQAILVFNPIKLFLLLALFAFALSTLIGLISLVSGLHSWLIITWIGLSLGIVIFAMGLLADAIRSKKLINPKEELSKKE